MNNIEQLMVPAEVVEKTLASLKEAGARNAEGVVLWLGRRHGTIEIVEAYIPEFESEYGFFSIPRESMAALLRHLGNTRTFLAAQVHSHPHEAFHSLADDQWAIVRHVGALSMVVPDFAEHTSGSSFAADVAVFSLSPENEWLQLNAQAVRNALQIV